MAMASAWTQVERIQETVSSFIVCALGDEQRSHTISMVSTELVENAVKYGDHADGEPEAIEFSLKGDADEVVIEVKNRVRSGDSVHLKRLDETIQWIRGYQNPYEAYVERLKSVSKSRTSESMLGMVRIAYEGSGILDFFVDENDQISVSATISLE